MKRVVLIFGALVAAVWYFVLRVGPRREPPDGAVPVTAEGAIDHARRVAAVDQVTHPDLVGTWAPTTATRIAPVAPSSILSIAGWTRRPRASKRLRRRT